MKKEFGKPVEQLPLEDIEGMSADTEVSLLITASPRPVVVPVASKSQQIPGASEAPIKTAQDTEAELHPLLVGTQKKLQANPVAGVASSGGKGVFSVTVSPELVARALRVLDRLLRAVEAQGWSVARTEKGMQLSPNGEAVSCTLTEQIDRVRHKIMDVEREALARFETKRAAAARRGEWFGSGNRPQIPEWDYRPTGRLVLRLDPNPYAFGVATGLRRTFNETRSRRLEDQIEKIIEALAVRAVAAKETRRLDAEREARWAEEAAKRKEAERRQRLEAKREEFLESQLERHTAARELESFLERYDGSELAEQPEAEFFIAWARRRLKSLESELELAALGTRFAKAELMSDDADVPSWKKVE